SLLLEPFVDRELAPSDRPGGTVGELLRQRARFRHHLLSRHGVVYHSDSTRFGTVDEVAAHEEFLCAMWPNEQRPDHGAAVPCDDADLDVTVGEPPLLR